MHDDAAHLAAVLGAGGAGYLVKGSSSEEFLLALRSVALGRSYIRVSVGDEGLREVTTVRKSSVPPAGLSTREREVLKGVAKGFSSREIAEQLGVKLKTVEAHRNSLKNKLGVNGRAALVDYALREGIVQGK
jgi:two-component system response regulator NreC